MNAGQFIGENVGKPWQDRKTGPDSFDCWGLVLAYFEQVHGYNVPYVPGYSDGSVDVVAAFEKLDRDGDLVPSDQGVVFMAFRGNRAQHIGVLAEGGCLHALGNTNSGGQVYFHSLPVLRRMYDKVSTYRFYNGK